jgi:metallo-beta-lactamase family protein
MIQDRVQIQFYGAAGEVTGSAAVFSYTDSAGRSTRILVDCGMFQGAKTDRIKNRDSIAYSPETLDAVILTHAHLDHSGLLPRLGRSYAGHVYASEGSADLLKVMLMDAAKLQEEDAEYANRTGYSTHKPAEPLYETADAKKILQQIKPLPYLQWFRLNDHIQFQFHRTGHIVGSSAIELRIEDQGERFIVGFSGDLGHHRSATLEGPAPLFDCDWLVLESTYGDRPNGVTDVDAKLAQFITEVTVPGGVVVIPAFAVGRAQELIYRIRMLEETGRIKPVPVILDSPMSEDATVVYLEHEEDFKKGSEFKKNKKRFFPERFEIVKNHLQSTENCARRGPLIVISASGMLQGGRVLHHLKGRLPNPKNGVLFVGYQAEGTKGRFLSTRPTEIRIHHEPIAVNARIEMIPGLSGHADQNELIEWVKTAKKRPGKVILNHGHVHAIESLKSRMERELSIEVTAILKPGQIASNLE